MGSSVRLIQSALLQESQPSIGVNTYTGRLRSLFLGTLAVSVNDALGTNAAGTVIASGATLDLQSVIVIR